MDDPEVYFLRFFNTNGNIGEKRMHIHDIEDMLVESLLDNNKRRLLLTESKKNSMNLIEVIKEKYKELFIDKTD